MNVPFALDDVIIDNRTGQYGLVRMLQQGGARMRPLDMHTGRQIDAELVFVPWEHGNVVQFVKPPDEVISQDYWDSLVGTKAHLRRVVGVPVKVEQNYVEDIAKLRERPTIPPATPAYYPERQPSSFTPPVRRVEPGHDLKIPEGMYEQPADKTYGFHPGPDMGKDIWSTKTLHNARVTIEYSSVGGVIGIHIREES